MPGNDILINGTFHWYVGDSKMDELVKTLDKLGSRQPNTYEEEPQDEQPSTKINKGRPSDLSGKASLDVATQKG